MISAGGGGDSGPPVRTRALLVRETPPAEFRLEAPYEPQGDQPEAIRHLIEGVRRGDRWQTLLGVTGSGKTFTIANVVAQRGRPRLVISHNKTLAAQLYGEFRQFFPEDAVGYFISYYDYYQPEAYVPQSDTYIEKEATINDDIDRMRHAATRSLLDRRDVVNHGEAHGTARIACTRRPRGMRGAGRVGWGLRPDSASRNRGPTYRYETPQASAPASMSL